MINLVKVFFSTWFRILESPGEFFNQERSQIEIKKTVTYFLIIAIFSTVFHVISSVFLRMYINMKYPAGIGSMQSLFSLKGLSVSVMGFFMFGILQTLILFLLQLAAKCRLTFNEVFGIFVYSMSPLLLSALPVGPLKTLAPIWQIAIIAIGIKQYAKISKSKTAAILVPYVLLVVVASLIYLQRVTLPKTQQRIDEIMGQASKDTDKRVLLDESDGWKVTLQDNGKIIHSNYRENGNLNEQICYKNQYAERKKNIEWEKQYNEEGILTFSKQYLDKGKSVIVTQYWNDGTIKERQHYKEGKILESKGGALHYGSLQKDGKSFVGDISQKTAKEVEADIKQFYLFVKEEKYESAYEMLSKYMKGVFPVEVFHKVFSDLNQKYGQEDDFIITEMLFDGDVQKIEKPENKNEYEFYDSILSSYISKRQQDIRFNIGIKKEDGSPKISSISWGIRGSWFSGYEEPEKKETVEEQMLREYGWHIDKTKLLQFKSVSIYPEEPKVGDRIEILLTVENTSEEVINAVMIGVKENAWGSSKLVTFSPKQEKKVLLFLNTKHPGARENSPHVFNVEAQYRNRSRKLADFELIVE